MRSARFLSAPLAAAIVGCLACGESPYTLPLGTSRQAVVGGEASFDQQSVLRVFGRPPPGTQPPRTCTGTLVAPNLVLTALHCVSPLIGDGNFGCSLEGELLNPPNGSLGTPLEPQYVNVHGGQAFTLDEDAVGAALVHTRSTQICQNDLAFIILDRELDYPISPLRLDTRVTIGETVSVVGYGFTQNPPPPANEVTQRRYRTNLPVIAVESEGREKTRPRMFTLGESVCMGDSGGAAFSEEGAVLGVYSTNAAGCEGTNARNAFTMLSAFKALTLQAFEAAGATPWLEGQPAPGTVIDAGEPPGNGGSGGTEPEPSLDAGLHPLDSTPPEEVPSIPQNPGGRVDSGFCAAAPSAHHGGSGFTSLLALAAVCVAAVRRKRQR